MYNKLVFIKSSRKVNAAKKVILYYSLGMLINRQNVIFGNSRIKKNISKRFLHTKNF